MPSRQFFPSESRSSRTGLALRKPGVRRPLHGFTLVELLVVIAIIGLLTGLLLPAINSAREAGRRSACNNNMKQIVLAMVSYESANRSFPPGRMGCDAFTSSPCAGLKGPQRPGTSAFLAILPQMDDAPTYSLFAPLFTTTNSTPPFGGVYPADPASSGWVNVVGLGSNVTVAQALMMRPSCYVCPSDIAKSNNGLLNPPASTTSYDLVLGSLITKPPTAGSTATDELYQKYYNNGPFIYSLAHRSADVRDGLSNTIFVGETAGGDQQLTMNLWPLSTAYLSCMRSTYNPLNTQSGGGTLVKIANSGLTSATGLPSVDGLTVTGGFSSMHPQGANFGFGDGHVKYLANVIDLSTYQALSTIDGAEAISGEF